MRTSSHEKKQDAMQIICQQSHLKDLLSIERQVKDRRVTTTMNARNANKLTNQLINNITLILDNYSIFSFVFVRESLKTKKTIITFKNLHIKDLAFSIICQNLNYA